MSKLSQLSQLIEQALSLVDDLYEDGKAAPEPDIDRCADYAVIMSNLMTSRDTLTMMADGLGGEEDTNPIFEVREAQWECVNCGEEFFDNPTPTEPFWCTNCGDEVRKITTHTLIFPEGSNE